MFNLPLNNISFKSNSFLISLIGLVSTTITVETAKNANGLAEAISTNGQLGFQVPASPVFEGIVAFHDDLMIFLSLIFGFVLYIFAACLLRFGDKNKDTARLIHASVLEIV
jgi:heme/copper-type cytochrome/quinol oxidase subunit 2